MNWLLRLALATCPLLFACGARSPLEEGRATTRESTTTTSTSTSTSTSSGSGGAPPLLACHPGDPPAIVGTKTGAFQIAVDPSDVHFAGMWEDTVGRVPKLGGEVVVLAAQQFSTWFLALDHEHVYWSGCTAGACGVSRIPKAGGTPEPIASLPGFGGLAVDGDSVFVVRDTGPEGAVVRVPKAGGAAQQLAPGPEGAWGLAIDDEFVYWTDMNAGSVRRVRKNGGASEEIASTSVGAMDIAVDDTRVYWSVFASASGFVASAPKAGGSATTLIANLDEPAGIAVDEASLYVAVQESGWVLKVSKAGGPMVFIAIDQVRPSNVAVDEACVYWANRDGTIMRAPK